MNIKLTSAMQINEENKQSKKAKLLVANKLDAECACNNCMRLHQPKIDQKPVKTSITFISGNCGRIFKIQKREKTLNISL
jgi:hypothetical protein